MNLIEVIFLIFIIQISSFLMIILSIILLKDTKEIKTQSIKQGMKQKIKSKKNEKKENEELRLLNIALNNIDSYDGTTTNQKEVK